MQNNFLDIFDLANAAKKQLQMKDPSSDINRKKNPVVQKNLRNPINMTELASINDDSMFNSVNSKGQNHLNQANSNGRNTKGQLLSIERNRTDVAISELRGAKPLDRSV